MKKDPNCKIHEIAGETIVVNQGGSQCEHDTHHLTGRIGTQALSDVGGAGLHGRGAARVLVDTYGIDPERALQDAERCVLRWWNVE